MLKLLFLLPPLLMFALVPQEPAAPPAPAAPVVPAAPVAPAGIPADAAALTNPVKATPESQAHAKATYKYDCAMCHGANGDGKGELVADMKLSLKDWTDGAALKDKSDGELFYIIKNGKGQMPAERGTRDDLWNMVVLVRSLAKK